MFVIEIFLCCGSRTLQIKTSKRGTCTLCGILSCGIFSVGILSWGILSGYHIKHQKYLLNEVWVSQFLPNFSLLKPQEWGVLNYTTGQKVFLYYVKHLSVNGNGNISHIYPTGLPFTVRYRRVLVEEVLSLLSSVKTVVYFSHCFQVTPLWVSTLEWSSKPCNSKENIIYCTTLYVYSTLLNITGQQTSIQLD